MADNILPTVAELQAARTQHIDRALRDIGSAIRVKEDQGYRQATYWLKPNDRADDLVTILLKAGYKALEKIDLDPRDGGGKFLDITWS